MNETQPTLRERYRVLRKWLLESTPFVKRKRYRKIFHQLMEQRDRYGDLTKIFLSISELNASRAKHHELINFRKEFVKELCLFVTFAQRAEIKQHVFDHISALFEENIAVVLIINTSHPHTAFSLPQDITNRLYGLMVRENKGFDFGAWAHAFNKLELTNIEQRLYLINDSIVGPLKKKNYSNMIASIRKATADCIGLTGNADPRWHLQSFFLVINHSLLRSTHFKDFMLDVLNLPTKQDVIDTYETHLTDHIQAAGYLCETIFPSLAPNRHLCNDTIFSWEQLVEIGFPFVKSSIVRQLEDHPSVLRLVPPQYRRP